MKVMGMTRLLFAVCLLSMFAGPVQAQTAVPGDSLAVKADVDKLKSEVAALKKLTISAYVQARYESHQDSRDDSVDVSGKIIKSNQNNILIREARLKTQYQAAKTSRFVFYLDAGKDKLRLLEAWVELSRDFGLTKAILTAGQQNIPFGYEIEYSSAKRDFPERSTWERKLFAGERDRLVNLVIQPSPRFACNVAVLNGPGINDDQFTWESPFKGAKSLAARVRGNAAIRGLKVSGGLSGYLGTQFDRSNSPGFRSIKNRWGADLQLFYPLFPTLGETSLRVEGVDAREMHQAARGGYVWLAQPFTRKFTAAVRVDSYDPNVDVKDGKELSQYSLAGNYFYDDNVRITLAYDLRRNRHVQGKQDPKDDILTVQFQYAF